MNKSQRILLISFGTLVVIVQVVGIVHYGLDECKGWAVSFLIAGILLFLGLGTWGSPRSFLLEIVQKLRTKPANESPQDSNVVLLQTPSKTIPKTKEFGVHISELDLHIEAQKSYFFHFGIFIPHLCGGRTLNWCCCASVYAGIRLAQRKANLQINGMVWNTVVHGIVVRMIDNSEFQPGSPSYAVQERKAYQELEEIDKAIENSLKNTGSFLLEPIGIHVGRICGCNDNTEAMKALTANLAITANDAIQKIIPEILQNLT